MTQFEVGKTYECHSIGNWECVWRYEVTARTASTITLKDQDGKVIKRKVIKGLSEINKTEIIFQDFLNIFKSYTPGTDEQIQCPCQYNIIVT